MQWVSHLEVDAAIAQIGVADVLDASVSEDDVEHPKPAPDIYRLAAQRLGADPAEALAFEDSETGARAAFDAGLQVIAVPSMPGQSPIAHRTLTALEDPTLQAWIRSWETTR